MRPGRLELPHPEVLEPKSSASANSATGAFGVTRIGRVPRRSRYRHSARAAAAGTVCGVSKRRHRPLLIVFVAVLAVAFVALGWWQYNRFEGAGGNARNLGYAMQWPLFAVAAVWGYKRFIELEEEADLLREAQEEGGTVGPVAAGSDPSRPTALPEGFLPSRRTVTVADERDDGLEHYNRLLADLAADDQRQEHSA